MSEPKSINLFFTEHSSDKVYQAQLVQRDDGWAVTFQYGRRGKALQAGEKGSGLPYDKACKIYDKLVSEKTSKGYTTHEDGAVFSGAEMAGRDTGFRPQLLNEITLDEAFNLGDDWLVQEKHNGERRVLISDASGTRYANKKGLEVGVQEPIADAFAKLVRNVGANLTLDAEDMGDHVVIFDMPPTAGGPNLSFGDRAVALGEINKIIRHLGIQRVLRVDVPVPAPVFFQGGLGELQAIGAEGFVAHRKDSLYLPGKSASGGEHLKVKFWEDISCLVADGRDGKRSVGLRLLDDAGEWQPVGNLTIPPNAAMPEAGRVVDVKYLYAHKGGSIYQPSLLRIRNDVDPAECRMDRLKYLPTGTASEPDEPEGAMSMGM